MNECEIRQKLVAELISTSAKSEELQEFKNILYKNFMKFSNSEKIVPNEAEMILNLQEIEKELELISSFPALHTKTTIAVGGGFSAGKSEFISSFIKTDVKLPIGVVPTTAIPSYVINNQKDIFIACNKKGGVVNLAEIDKNFHSKLSHDFIESFGFNLKELMPFMILGTETNYKNICFVDTPGYNPASTTGFTDEDIKTAKEFLENSDIFIWLIGADANGTLSSTDLEFLDGLDLKNKKFYLVLNKADVRPIDSLEDVLEEIEEQLEDYDIEFEGISAYSSTMKQEFSYLQLSLFDFLEKYNNESSKHNEMMDRLMAIYTNYKYYILKTIQEKKEISKILNSISLDILEDGVNNENAFTRLEYLKNIFSTKKENKLLEELDTIFIVFQESIQNIFKKPLNRDIRDIIIDEIDIDFDENVELIQNKIEMIVNKKQLASEMDIVMLESEEIIEDMEKMLKNLF
jgi:signal recognition particle receptor subunit beta